MHILFISNCFFVHFNQTLWVRVFGEDGDTASPVEATGIGSLAYAVHICGVHNVAGTGGHGLCVVYLWDVCSA